MADPDEKLHEVPSAESPEDSPTFANSAGESLDDKEWAPIRPSETNRINKTISKAPSGRSLSRVRSQNGYGVGDDSSDEDVESGANTVVDPYEVRWENGDNDPMNPRSRKNFTKWVIVLICAASSFCVTCTSSIYTSTYSQMTEEFHCSTIVATLGLSLFVMGLGCGPMLLSPLSEFYGRRPIYLASFGMFLIWIIPSTVSKNIETMLIARFFDGFSGSAFLSVSGGTVGDLFNRQSMHAPMMVFTAAPFVGPSLGPLIGGFINQYVYWRWTYYVLLMWAGAMFCLIFVFVPETYHPVMLRRKAVQKRKETGDDRWHAPIEKMNKSIAKTVLLSLTRPFQLLALEPMCSCLCLYSAILLGVLYLFFGTISLVFRTNHDFTLSEVGLSFMGIFVGMIIGVATDPFWHKNYLKLVRNREAAGGEPGGSEPEYRLPPAIFGAFAVPIGIFLFGWTSYRSVHWILPIIGTSIFGFGVVLVFSGVFTFLVDAYPLYAASALAANSFARSSFAAAFPLFGVQMYEKLGYQWASSLLAFLCVAMLPFPYIFFRYGKRIRGTSRFAQGRI